MDSILQFLDEKLAELDYLRSKKWRSPDEPRWIRGDEMWEKHFKFRNQEIRRVCEEIASALIQFKDQKEYASLRNMVAMKNPILHGAIIEYVRKCEW